MLQGHSLNENCCITQNDLVLYIGIIILHQNALFPRNWGSVASTCGPKIQGSRGILSDIFPSMVGVPVVSSIRYMDIAYYSRTLIIQTLWDQTK